MTTLLQRVGRLLRPAPEQDDAVVMTRALAGDRAAQTLLVEMLRGPVQAQMLSFVRHRGYTRDVPQRVADLTQDIFLYLFEDNLKVLRSWDPHFGVPLVRFITMVAKRKAWGILNAKRHQLDFAPQAASQVLEFSLHTNPLDGDDQWVRVAMTRVRESLSEKGQDVFDMLFRDQATVAEISARQNLTREAVYQWRSRLRRAIRRELNALQTEGETP